MKVFEFREAYAIIIFKMPQYSLYFWVNMAVKREQSALIMPHPPLHTLQGVAKRN